MWRDRSGRRLPAGCDLCLIFGVCRAVSHSFVIFYAVLDVLILATLLLMIASFWRGGRGTTQPTST
jgi:hypothetical protein